MMETIFSVFCRNSINLFRKKEEFTIINSLSNNSVQSQFPFLRSKDCLLFRVIKYLQMNLLLTHLQKNKHIHT
jgi:hypothetical protein